MKQQLVWATLGGTHNSGAAIPVQRNRLAPRSRRRVCALCQTEGAAHATSEQANALLRCHVAGRAAPKGFPSGPQGVLTI